MFPHQADMLTISWQAHFRDCPWLTALVKFHLNRCWSKSPICLYIYITHIYVLLMWIWILILLLLLSLYINIIVYTYIYMYDYVWLCMIMYDYVCGYTHRLLQVLVELLPEQTILRCPRWRPAAFFSTTGDAHVFHCWIIKHWNTFDMYWYGLMIKAHHQLTPQSTYINANINHPLVFCFGMMQKKDKSSGKLT